MFDNFVLKEKPIKIAGYSWALDNPDYVVCLIHGIGEYAGRYDKRVAAAFNKANIAVLALDLRGHGLSGGKRGDTAPREGVLEDIDALVGYAQKKYPGKPIILYGHSMGGNITLDYRLRGKLSAVSAAYIISAPWVRLYKQYPAPAVGLMKLMAKLTPTVLIPIGIEPSVLGNPKCVGEYYKDPLVHKHISARCAVEGYFIGQALEKNELEGNAGGRQRPLLLMHGDNDKICSVEGSRSIAAFEENCTYVEWPGLSHEIHNGGGESTGDEVIARMVEFIRTLPLTRYSAPARESSQSQP